MKLPRTRYFLLPCLFLSLASCATPTFPVEGKVTLHGEPLRQGSVVFWPDETKGNTYPYPSTSEIAEDGTFALYTKGAEGAPVGAYKVTVIAEDLADSTDPGKTKLLVPAEYTNRETTPLSKEVVSDPADNAYDLNLK